MPSQTLQLKYCKPMNPITPLDPSHQSTHLENLLIEQTRSKHRDAIGVHFCVVAAGERTGHLLLAVHQQRHVFLGNGERDAVPPGGIKSTFKKNTHTAANHLAQVRHQNTKRTHNAAPHNHINPIMSPQPVTNWLLRVTDLPSARLMPLNSG